MESRYPGTLVQKAPREDLVAPLALFGPVHQADKDTAGEEEDGAQDTDNTIPAGDNMTLLLALHCGGDVSRRLHPAHRVHGVHGVHGAHLAHLVHRPHLADGHPLLTHRSRPIPLLLLLHSQAIATVERASVHGILAWMGLLLSPRALLLHVRWRGSGRNVRRIFFFIISLGKRW